MQFSPPVARLNLDAYLTVTVSEPLLANAEPVLTWQLPAGDPGFAFETSPGLQTFTFKLTVTANSQPGVYRLATISMTDVAGNLEQVPVEAGIAVFEVDNELPQVTSLQVNRDRFSDQEGFREVEVSFEVSEPPAVPDGLKVLVGARPAACAPEGSGYRCHYTVQRGDPEGPTLIQVTATDAAGNAGFGSLSVVFDLTPPALLSSSASRSAGASRRR